MDIIIQYIDLIRCHLKMHKVQILIKFGQINVRKQITLNPISQHKKKFKKNLISCVRGKKRNLNIIYQIGLKFLISRNLLTVNTLKNVVVKFLLLSTVKLTRITLCTS